MLLQKYCGGHSYHFCNCAELMIQRSHPLHTLIGQRCGGKKKRTCLSGSLFSLLTQLFQSLFMWTTECNTKTVFQERLSGHMHCYLNNIMSPTSLWWPTFTPLLSVAVWNTFDPMLYKLVLIEHNLTLIVIIHCILLLYSIMLTSSFRASSTNLIKLSKKLFASESDWT